MPLTLSLTPELENYLTQKAQQHGLSVEAFVLQLLTEQIVDRQTEAFNLLQSWLDEVDIEEQQETGDYLIRALDDDRLSDRKLFPAEMKGVTW